MYQCLQLPVAVPSLVINLLAVSFPTTMTPKSAAAESILGCTMRNNSAPSTSRKRPRFAQKEKEGGFSRCSFPGAAVYAVANELSDLRNDIQRCDGTIGR